MNKGEKIIIMITETEKNQIVERVRLAHRILTDIVENGNYITREKYPDDIAYFSYDDESGNHPFDRNTPDIWDYVPPCVYDLMSELDAVQDSGMYETTATLDLNVTPDREYHTEAIKHIQKRIKELEQELTKHRQQIESDA